MAIALALLHRVRWRIFGLLFGFGCIADLQHLSEHGAWTAAFVTGTAFALFATAAWIGVDATRRISD